MTLDRKKAEIARHLVRAKSLSETIDKALDRLIRAEQLRCDVAAYTNQPPTDDEIALAELPVELDLDDAAVDYGAMYGRAR